MAQITIYIEEQHQKQLIKNAKKSKVSISQWVKEAIIQKLDDTWPNGYEKLFGAVSENELRRPEQGSSKNDSKRELM